MEFCRIPRPTRDRSQESQRYGRDRDRRRSRSRSPRDRRRSPLIRDRGRDHDYFRDSRGSDGYRSDRLGTVRGVEYGSYGLPHHQPLPGTEHPYGPPPQRGMGSFGPPPPPRASGLPDPGGYGRGPSAVGGLNRPSTGGAPPSGPHPPRGLLEPPYPLLSPPLNSPPSGGPNPAASGGASGGGVSPGNVLPPPGPGQGPPPRGGGGYSGPPSHVSSDAGVPVDGGFGRTEPGTRDSYNGPPPSRGGSGGYFAGAGKLAERETPGGGSKHVYRHKLQTRSLYAA